MMSMEKRILIAFVLSAVVFAVWTMIFPPPKPVAPESPARETVQTTAEDLSVEGVEEENSGETPALEAEAPAEAIPGAVGAEQEEEYILENDDIRMVFSNRGACATSIVLKKYSGDEGEILDLVQSTEHPEKSFPFQLMEKNIPDTRLYACVEEPGLLRFSWSDGLGRMISKELKIRDEGYGLSFRCDVLGSSEMALSMGTGMRDTDISERENRFATWGDAVVIRATEKKKKVYRRQKTGDMEVLSGQGVQQIGFEDTYFLNVYSPLHPLKSIQIRGLESAIPDGEAGEIEKQRNEKEQKKDAKVLQINLLSPDGVFEGEVFPGPKEYDLLRVRDRGLEKTLHFGIFHPIAVLSLKALRWIFSHTGNWGIAIILLTIGIRILLFPLVHKSTVSMRKMQKVQPKVKAIQEKYRKNKSDPQIRAKMNQETMELYKQEGVNPVGGCLPTFIQLPILFALYTLFAHAIELRHAPFIWWITDLSAKDPLLITPILMTASMWLQQKLAPQAGDPKQMKMMRFMPLIFGIMFLGFPSGLVLYWLTNNVVTIIQQEITLHLIGERKGRRPAAKKGGKK